MNNSEILSIFIPTFNRAEVLRRTLRETMPIARDYDLNVYISDNASSDKTQEVVLEFQQLFNNIFYFRNDENIGIDRNHLRFLDLCKERYVWFLGDDDFPTRTGVKLVLENLKNDIDINSIFLGTEDENWRNGVKRDKIVVTQNSVDIFNLAQQPPNYGKLIVNVERALKYYSQLIQFIGTSHAYASIPFLGVDKKKFIFISKDAGTLVVIGRGEKTWSNNFSQIVYHDLLLWLCLLPSNLLKGEAIKRIFKSFYSWKRMRRYCTSFASPPPELCKNISMLRFVPLKFKILKLFNQIKLKK